MLLWLESNQIQLQSNRVTNQNSYREPPERSKGHSVQIALKDFIVIFQGNRQIPGSPRVVNQFKMLNVLYNLENKMFPFHFGLQIIIFFITIPVKLDNL